MSGNSSRISTTLAYKVQLDTADVLSGVKNIEKELKAKGANLLPVDGMMKQLDGLGKKIQEQLAQGFSSLDDIKNLQKDYTSFLKIGDKLNQSFRDLNTNTDKITLDQLKEDLDTSQKKVKNLIANAKLLFKTQTSGTSGAKDFTNLFLKGAEDGKDLVQVQKQISDQLEKQVAAEREKAALAQQNYDIAKSQFDETTSIKNTTLNGRPFQNSKGKTVSKSEFEQVSAAYSKTAQATALKGGTGVDALKALKKELSSFGIVVADEQAVLTAFNKTLAATGNQPTIFKEASSELTKTDEKLKSVTENAQKLNSVFTSDNAVETYQSISAAAQDAGEKTQKVSDAQKAMSNPPSSLTDFGNLLQNGANSMDEWSDSAKEMFDQQKNIDNVFDSLTTKVGTFFSAFAAIGQLKNILKETFEDVKEIDKSFAEIAMVTDYSIQDMWDSYGQYSQMANELGQSTVDVVRASGLFYQQGLETNEVLDLTRSTMKLATLAGQDFKEATSEMTAALRGFHMEMDQGEHIADVYSELAAKAAADVEGIAYAMSKTASIGA